MHEARRLPGVSLSLSGDASIVQSLLTGLFGLCPAETGAADVRLECRSLAGDSPPRWMAEALLSERGATGADRILDGGEAPCAPVGGSDSRLLAGPCGEVGVVERGGDGLCLAWLDANRETITFLLGRSGSIAPLVVLGPLLREVLLDRDRVLLHSGCVARPDGRGLLLLADGGGGKTTAVAALLHAGCRLLGDDLNALRADERGIEVRGWPERLNVTDATAAFFPELTAALAAVPKRTDWHKRAVAPEAAFGAACMAERCRLAGVCVLRISREGPSLRRLTASEALDHLFAAHRMHPDQRIGRRAFGHLTALVANVPAFECSMGPAPRGLGRWLLAESAAWTHG
jgi:hypothetical protein